MALVAAWTSLYFTATSLTQLLVGYILSGIPFGIFQTLVISYASEVCPIALRGYLTTWVNACWGIGQLLGVGSVKGASHWNDHRAFRVPYSLQWIWPLPLSIAVFLAPESPWWLVRKGRIEDAKKSLRRLTSLKRDTDFDPDETVAMIAHTTALEQQITAGATYADCFRVSVEATLYIKPLGTALTSSSSPPAGHKSAPYRNCGNDMGNSKSLREFFRGYVAIPSVLHMSDHN